ncbi:MAG: hypothetical protein QM658_01325 [Gordonia sp. (in: high G+C Gram-positive bacteria)]
MPGPTRLITVPATATATATAHSDAAVDTSTIKQTATGAATVQPVGGGDPKANGADKNRATDAGNGTDQSVLSTTGYIDPKNLPPTAEVQAVRKQAATDADIISHGEPVEPERPEPPATNLDPHMSNGEMADRTAKAANDPKYKSAMAKYNTDFAAYQKNKKAFDDATNRLYQNSDAVRDALAASNGERPVKIPRNSLIYMKAFQGSLDCRGKDPGLGNFENLQKDTSPRGKRTWAAIQGSLQWMSDPDVVTDGKPPMRGSFENLPASFKKFPKYDYSKSEKDNLGDTPQGKKSGFAQANRIARLVTGTQSVYLTGSQLNRKLGDVGFQTLRNVQGPNFSDYERNQLSKYPNFAGSPFFNAISDDKVTISRILNDPKTGTTSTIDMMTWPWPDDGAIVAKMLTFPPDQKQSRVAAQIMSAIGRHASGGGTDSGAQAAWELFSNLKASDGNSIGKENPLMVQAIGRSMVPFIGDISGSEIHDGFDNSWASPGGDGYAGSTALVALINTDNTAGTEFNGNLMAARLAALSSYTKAKDQGDPNAGENLAQAGVLGGILTKGTYIAAKDEAGDAARQAIHQRQEESYDYMVDTLGIIGLGRTADAITLGGGTLKDWVIGKEPPPPAGATTTGPQSTAMQYTVLERAAKVPAKEARLYPWTVDKNTGKMRPLSQLKYPQIYDKKTHQWREWNQDDVDQGRVKNPNSNNRIENAVRAMFTGYSSEHEREEYQDKYTSIVDYGWGK